MAGHFRAADGSVRHQLLWQKMHSHSSCSSAARLKGAPEVSALASWLLPALALCSVTFLHQPCCAEPAIDLFIAAQNGYAHCVELLLAHDAQVDQPNSVGFAQLNMRTEDAPDWPFHIATTKAFACCTHAG